MKFCEKQLMRIAGLHTTSVVESGSVPVIRYDRLEKIPWVKNGFSTRIGGVSTGDYESMNLSFTVGDDEAAVLENFKRFGAALGISVEDMVYSHQTHTTNVMRVEQNIGIRALRQRQ